MKILNSEAVLGLWNLSPSGFHKQLTAEEGRLLIKAAWRMGIRTFDTAFSYADADSILHRALKEINGTDAAVISKVMPVPTLRRKAETSLRRLGIESFAVLLLHWPSSPDDVRRSLDELTKLKEEGKAKAIGVSNFPLPMLAAAAGEYPIEYHERPLSLIWNKDWPKESALGLRTLVYAPLGMGLLSGKYSVSGITDRRKDLPFLSSPSAAVLLDALHGDAATALSWVYSQSPWGVVSGFRNERELQLLSNVRKLDEAEERRLSAIAGRISGECSTDNIFAHRWE